MTPINSSRRRLLRGAALAMLAQSGSALCTPLRLCGNLLAATAPAAVGYRALVCVYLSGGNDSFNLLVPHDSAVPLSHYDTYRLSRGGVYDAMTNPLGLALDFTKILDVGGGYGLHPQTDDYAATRADGSAVGHPGLAALYASSKKLAFIANVGPLVEPLTMQGYLSGNPAPTQLFSHNDQEGLWHLGTADAARRYGWGGLALDALGPVGSVPPCISVAGSSRFEIGMSVFPYSLSSAIGVTQLENYDSSYDQAIKRRGALDALEQLLSPNLLLEEYRHLQQSSLDLSTTLAGYLASSDGQIDTPYDYAGSSKPDPAGHFYPNANLQFGGNDYANPLLDQLRMVARMIKVSSAQNRIGQQIFYVNLGGFDTHSSQMQRHPVLIAQLSQALGWFWQALGDIGRQDQVTTFTMSDFGRTLASNGDGSDHAWGGVQLALGGQVKGGQVYGATDEFGFAAADKPVPVHDLHATMLHLLGFDHTRLTYRYAGRDFRLTDVHGQVVHDLIA